eukprot:806400-Prorocentrum_minimum.AAC.1
MVSPLGEKGAGVNGMAKGEKGAGVNGMAKGEKGAGVNGMAKGPRGTELEEKPLGFSERCQNLLSPDTEGSGNLSA